MRKIIFYSFVFYWILAFVFAKIEKSTSNKLIKIAVGTVFPRNYRMMVDFPTRQANIYYEFYSKKDTLKINGTEVLRSQIKNKFPLIGGEFVFLNSMDYDSRVLDNSFAKIHWKCRYDNPIEKLNKKQADSITLILNNRKQKKFVELYKKYALLLIDIHRIDTTKYTNFSFQVKSKPTKLLTDFPDSYYQDMGSQVVLSGFKSYK